jgi:hypothetical protein
MHLLDQAMPSNISIRRTFRCDFEHITSLNCPLLTCYHNLLLHGAASPTWRWWKKMEQALLSEAIFPITLPSYICIGHCNIVDRILLYKFWCQCVSKYRVWSLTSILSVMTRHVYLKQLEFPLLFWHRFIRIKPWTSIQGHIFQTSYMHNNLSCKFSELKLLVRIGVLN